MTKILQLVAWFMAIILLMVGAACQVASRETETPPVAWSSAELSRIRNMWLGNLGSTTDIGNAYATNMAAAEFGQRLFFDSRLSADGTISCATCHQPERFFSDGRPLAEGLELGRRNTPTLVGAAHSRWYFWDGRRDSLWAQALSPLEAAHEQGLTRLEIVRLVDSLYRPEYENVFGPLPDFSDRQRFPERASPLGNAAAQTAWASMAGSDRQQVDQVFVNLGKAIGAYELRLQPGPARFDDYAQALLAGDEARAATILTGDEAAGLRLFIGPALCTNCHSGPLLQDPYFHNTGLPDASGDPGRADGAPLVLADPFNCYGSFSDATPEQCRALNEVRVEGAGLAGAFKTPTLRNIAETAPYMHNGQLATLQEVLQHYNEAPSGAIGRSELQPLDLSPEQLGQLEAFLRTLSGSLAGLESWLMPPGQ